MVSSVNLQGTGPLPHLRISPPKKWIPLDLIELRNYRELLSSFTWRDVKIRYKQTAFGFLWAIIQTFSVTVFLLMGKRMNAQ